MISVIAASLILSILTSVTDEKSSEGKLLRLLGGLYLTIVVIHPVVGFDFGNLQAFFDELTPDTQAASEYGQELAQEQFSDIIKSKAEAYILDKAGLYPADVTVEVMISEEEIPVPESVIIRGVFSEDAKYDLQNMIESDLDIPKEHQTWIGTP